MLAADTGIETAQVPMFIWPASAAASAHAGHSMIFAGWALAYVVIAMVLGTKPPRDISPQEADDMNVNARAELTVPGHVADGWSALARRDWASAWRSFDTAVGEQENAAALEGLSWAAWWLSDIDALFDARERAYRAYREAGLDRDAARVATWLGTDSVDFRGEIAVAQGWLRRARGLLEGSDACPELGWLDVHEAEKLLVVGRSEEARELGVRAASCGRHFAIMDLEMMGMATQGLALVKQGNVDEGIAWLSETTTAALADEFTELWSAGWCCCYMLYACEQVRDYDRAAQWCRKVDAWSERLNLRPLNWSCRANYAGVLIWRGTWLQAEAELTESVKQLAELRPPLALDASVRLGELRRRQGRYEEAANIFEHASDHPLATLGIGELCLDLNDASVACERAQEYLRQTSSDADTSRVAGLELLARSASISGDLELAVSALHELSTIADRIPTEPIKASVAHVRGVVASARGEGDRARIAFEDAVRYYHRAHAPFEEALSRMALASELKRVGRNRQALQHAQVAAQVLHHIGAAKAAETADTMTRSLEPSKTASLLTTRECEILRLVAKGETNRSIARLLVLSEHTINRHVTNALTKLGTGSRSAAVAEALRRGLI